jgi:NADH dehydrogenase
MILLTGATGVVGSALLPRLLADKHQVRALVRDPRRLGRERVRVQIALADLADPHGLRHAMRGVRTVIHLGAATRDEPGARIEQVNALGTARLLQAAERAGVERFVFFSALNASRSQRTRYFRAKALAEEAVQASSLRTTVFAPSIVYGPDDPWVTMIRRMALLPVLPISGSGAASFQPICAADAASCVVAALGEDGGRHELAGPETLSYEGIARLIARSAGRERPVVHVPLGLVRRGLMWWRALAGPKAFATWEEAELLEVPMVSERGDADVRALGVEPRPMPEVLANASRSE